MLCEWIKFQLQVGYIIDVLILVLMEDALRVQRGSNLYDERGNVLILVLMEDALRATEIISVDIKGSQVLILVLMEDALRGHIGC